MEGQKPWFASIGIWGSLVVAVSQLLLLAGVYVPEKDQIEIASYLTRGNEAIISLITVFGAIASWYGRFRATQQISSKPLGR